MSFLGIFSLTLQLAHPVLLSATNRKYHVECIHTWISCLAIRASIISRHRLDQFLECSLIARLMALAQGRRHPGRRCGAQKLADCPPGVLLMATPAWCVKQASSREDNDHGPSRLSQFVNQAEERQTGRCAERQRRSHRKINAGPQHAGEKGVPWINMTILHAAWQHPLAQAF